MSNAKTRVSTRWAVKAAFGQQGLDYLDADRCPKCGSDSKLFNDPLSRREHDLSGLCQACQDVEFREPED